MALSQLKGAECLVYVGMSPCVAGEKIRRQPSQLGLRRKGSSWGVWVWIQVAAMLVVLSRTVTIWSVRVEA